MNLILTFNDKIFEVYIFALSISYMVEILFIYKCKKKKKESNFKGNSRI